jgi:nitrogen fixation NifU-like protein
MSPLRELYQALIIDHGKNPRHFGKLPTANCTAKGYNPFCGDELTLYADIDSAYKKVKTIRFTGVGCAISMASASLMSETLEGKTLGEVQEIFTLFQKQVTTDLTQDIKMLTKLGKLTILAGVRDFPSRVKCATLAWHTLKNALNNKEILTTTE